MTFYAGGMSIFFLFFTAQSGVTALLEERRGGTMARLLSSPISAAAVLGGAGVLKAATTLDCRNILRQRIEEGAAPIDVALYDIAAKAAGEFPQSRQGVTIGGHVKRLDLNAVSVSRELFQVFLGTLALLGVTARE